MSGRVSAAASSSFQPHWTLGNGHVQTLVQRLLTPASDVLLRQVSLPTPDGDFLELYVDVAGEAAEATAPIVLIAHGLEGNHREPYVRRLRHVVRAKGWGSVSMVHRSCGRQLNLARRLYHAGDTEDLATVVQWVAGRWPSRRLFVAGYSLSGNQLAKWLGTRAEEVPANVAAAAAISAPFDLMVTAPQIDRALGGVYRRYFLKTLIPKAVAKARQHPGSLDPERLRSIRSLREFDEAVTAPLHGFRDAEHYYRQSSCSQYLPAVRHPLLLLASADDPFSAREALPWAICRDQRWLRAEFTSGGGHVGFIAGTLRKPDYWAELQVLRFFESHAPARVR